MRGIQQTNNMATPADISDRSGGGGNIVPDINIPYKSHAGSSSGTQPSEQVLSSSTGSFLENSSSVKSRSSTLRSNNSAKVENEIKSRIRTSHSETARNRNLDSLEMNKLRFGNLGLHGRKKEMDILRVCFDRLVEAESDEKSERGNEAEGSSSSSTQEAGSGVTTATAICNKSSEVVLIKGGSGTGKTSLAESIKPRVSGRRGVYISGKFDLYQREPYFGITSAFRGLCTELLQLKRVNPTKYNGLCNDLKAEVGVGIALLVTICPDLDYAIDIDLGIHAMMTDTGNKEAKERLKYVFVQFFRVLTKHLTHLVLSIDDLQWGDIASMDLLDTLIKEKGISVMFIGIYRSNEVDDAHYLSKTIRDLHDTKQDGGAYELTEIETLNLDVPPCEEILVELLSADQCEETRSLAEIVHKRTMGNAFHILAYLSMLQEENLLSFNLGTLKWSWDAALIEAETEATSNVVELMKSKVMKLPEDVSGILHLASCIGTSFEMTLLVGAYFEMYGKLETSDESTETEEEEVRRLLSSAVDENLIELQGASRYIWVHDSIQEAAYHLASDEDELNLFRAKLGNVLLQILSERDKLEHNIFVVVNLLNAAPCLEADKIMIADLNLRAAKKSTEFSAFESCINFSKKGISLLPGTDRWTKHKKLTLELYSVCVEAHFSLGNNAMMNYWADEVLQQESLTKLEKVPIYFCKINVLGGSGKPFEALALSFDVLGKLGCNYPRNSVGQVIKALSSLKNTKLPEDVSALPFMTDEIKKACMVLMVNAATFAHYCENPFAMIMITARMVRWTIKYGVDQTSPVAFNIIGFAHIAVFQNFKRGTEFGDIGLSLLDDNNKTYMSRTMYLAWFMVFPYRKPIHSTLKHLLSGYKVGMEVGDAESSMWNVSMYICASLVAGKPLKALAVDCQTYFDQMKVLSQGYIITQSAPFWQFVLNMLGDAKDPLLMTGVAMNEDDYARIKDTCPWGYYHYLICKSILCNIFGDHLTAAKLALERGDIYEKKNGSPLAMLDTLHQGIAFYAMARKTRKKKYFRKAKKVRSVVSKWIEKGNVNVQHYLPLLEAEEAAFKRKPDDARRLYMDAITQASRSGFQHNAALASERLGEYLHHDLNEKERAKLYFNDAVKYYSGYGSDFKANMVEEMYLS